MRLRLTLDRLTLLDITLLEPDDAEPTEPDAVHDLSTSHEVGFSAAPGWREPTEDSDAARR